MDSTIRISLRSLQQLFRGLQLGGAIGATRQSGAGSKPGRMITRPILCRKYIIHINSHGIHMALRAELE